MSPRARGEILRPRLQSSGPGRPLNFTVRPHSPTRMNAPTPTDMIAFIRHFQSIPDRVRISPSTRLDADLGITGLDGDDLLRQAATRFGVVLASPEDGYRRTFSLAPNEYLFGSEGSDPLGPFGGILWVIRRIRGVPDPVVCDLTVGELHEAILRKWNDGRAA